MNADLYVTFLELTTENLEEAKEILLSHLSDEDKAAPHVWVFGFKTIARNSPIKKKD
jgi:hypothetical protein